MKIASPHIQTQQIHWIPFDKTNPPINLCNDQDDYTNGATWRYSVDIATPYGNYIDNYWDTMNDWFEGQFVEVVGYAELPYRISESELKGLENE